MITKEIKADIKVLDMELLDTRNNPGNLTGTLIADLVLQIFAYVAQTEREFIHQRQAEGIAAAKLSGKILGRKPINMPKGFENYCDMCQKGKMSIRKAAEIMGVKPTTFYRRYKEYIDDKNSHFT